MHSMSFTGTMEQGLFSFCPGACPPPVLMHLGIYTDQLRLYWVSVVFLLRPFHCTGQGYTLIFLSDGILPDMAFVLSVSDKQPLLNRGQTLALVGKSTWIDGLFTVCGSPCPSIWRSGSLPALPGHNLTIISICLGQVQGLPTLDFPAISHRLILEHYDIICFLAIPLHWPFSFSDSMVSVETIPLHSSAIPVYFAIPLCRGSDNDNFAGCHSLTVDFHFTWCFFNIVHLSPFVMIAFVLTIPLHWSTVIISYHIFHRPEYAHGIFTGHHGLTVEQFGILLFVSWFLRSLFDEALQCLFSHDIYLMVVAIPLHWHFPSSWARPLGKSIQRHGPEAGDYSALLHPLFWSIPLHWTQPSIRQPLCQAYPDRIWPQVYISYDATRCTL